MGHPIAKMIEPPLLAATLRFKIRRALRAGAAERAVEPRGIAVRTSASQVARLGEPVVADAIHRAFRRTRSPWKTRLPQLEPQYGAGQYGWLPEVWLTYASDVWESPPNDGLGKSIGNQAVWTERPESHLAYLQAANGQKRLPLSATTNLLIGRSQFCDIVLDDPRVSRQHARIWCEAGRWHIAPEPRATNPLLINGQAIDDAVEVTHGDVVGFGTKVRYTFALAVRPERAHEAGTTLDEDPLRETSLRARQRTRSFDLAEQATEVARQPPCEPTSSGQPTVEAAPRQPELAPAPIGESATAPPEGGGGKATSAVAPVPPAVGPSKPPRLRVLDAVEALVHATPRGWPGTPKDWVLSACDPGEISRADVHRLWAARNRSAHATPGDAMRASMTEAANIADRIVDHLESSGHALEIYDSSLANPIPDAGQS